MTSSSRRTVGIEVGQLAANQVDPEVFGRHCRIHEAAGTSGSRPAPSHPLAEPVGVAVAEPLPVAIGIVRRRHVGALKRGEGLTSS